MFPITVFKQNRVNSSAGDYEYKLPQSGDPYQFEVMASNALISRTNKNISLTKSVLSEHVTYCFYCGEESKNIVPCFLHDGSGINLWLIDDIRSSFVICKTCTKHAGKLSLSYKKRPRDVSRGKFLDLLRFEPEVLLPTIEPVDLHFSYSLDGLLIPKSARADRTIEVFALNRIELIDRRKITLQSIERENFGFTSYNNKLSDVYPMDRIFGGLATEIDELLFHDTEQDEDKLVSFYQLRKSTDADFKYKSYSFKSIIKNEIKNEINTNFVGLSQMSFNGVRDFERNQKVSFTGKDSVLLLGENGVGKSTLIALIEKAIKARARLNFTSFMSNNTNADMEPKVTVLYNNRDNSVHFSPSHRMKGRREPCNVISIPEGRISDSLIEKFQRWLLLNSDDEGLIYWVARKLKILLDLPNEYYFVVNKNLCFWSIEGEQGQRKYLDKFSSGYRSLMTAFYMIVSKLYSPDEDGVHRLELALSSTIILIDEIELHLHPRLKMRVVGVLQRVFPEVLFIISTHDPLVIKSANLDTKILLLKENEKGKTEIIDNLPSHMNLNTEQILTSPFFGLDSTSLDDKTDAWALYHAALNEGDREQASVYREKLAGSGLFGSTYREYLAFSAVDAYLAKKEIPRVDDVADLIDRIENRDA
jgi:energy-coupling factor transporter ATP-binding protein EcfA2